MTAKCNELVLDQFFPYQFSILAQQVSEFIAQIYGDKFGLSRFEWRVLAALGQYRELSATQIGRLTALEKMQVSRAIAKLKARQLLENQENRADARSQWLQLTDKGGELYREITPLVLAQEQQLLSGLSEQEQRQLKALTLKLSAQLSG